MRLPGKCASVGVVEAGAGTSDGEVACAAGQPAAQAVVWSGEGSGGKRIDPARVKGIGFDATCSLAVTDFQGNPVTVTKGSELGKVGDRNVILWADHRAEKEAALINSTGSVVLNYVGGVMSVSFLYYFPYYLASGFLKYEINYTEMFGNLCLKLEMEIPKTLWLKNNMDPDLFSRCQFFDLPDFLTYKATGETTRSACSLTCKCSYVPDKGEDHPAGWQDSFFTQIGLPEFVENNYAQIGPVENGLKAGRKKTTTLTAGIPVGKGLSKKSAEELGLLEGTPVGSAVIDACVSLLFICLSVPVDADNYLCSSLQHSPLSSFHATTSSSENMLCTRKYTLGTISQSTYLAYLVRNSSS